MEPNFLEGRLVNLGDCSDDDNDYDGNCDDNETYKVTTKSAFHVVTKVPNDDCAVCMDTVIKLTKSACSEGIERNLSQYKSLVAPVF